MMHALVMFVPLVNVFCATKLRGQVRAAKGLSGNGFGDFMATVCCFTCSIAQQTNELNSLEPKGMVEESVLERL